MTSNRSLVLAYTVMVSALVLAPRPAIADGADSPQAAFAAVQAAARDGDVAALVAQLLPSLRCDLTFVLIDDRSKVIFASDEKGKLSNRWHEVATKNGVLEDVETIETLYAEPEEKALAFLDDFRARMGARGCSALLADLLALLDETFETEEYGISLLCSFPAGRPEFESLAEYQVLAHSEEQALRFTQEDGRWYFLPEVLFD